MKTITEWGTLTRRECSELESCSNRALDGLINVNQYMERDKVQANIVNGQMNWVTDDSVSACIELEGLGVWLYTLNLEGTTLYINHCFSITM